MAVDPSTAPPPASGKTDSGEHPAAERSLRMRFGKNRIDIPLVATAKFVAVMVPAILGLVAAVRAPSKGEVDNAAKAKAAEVKRELEAPVDNHAGELAKVIAEQARLAGIVALYEKERQAAAAAAPASVQRQQRKRRQDPETAKKIEAAARDLKIIQARAAAPAPLTVTKSEPATNLQVQQQQQRDAGGAQP